LKSGVPDVCLPIARGGYHALYIELKRETGGTVGPAQRWWQEALRGVGNASEICRGARAAEAVLERYLALVAEDRPQLTDQDREHHAAKHAPEQDVPDRVVRAIDRGSAHHESAELHRSHRGRMSHARQSLREESGTTVRPSGRPSKSTA
jgi:VRR-NUC domain